MNCRVIRKRKYDVAGHREQFREYLRHLRLEEDDVPELLEDAVCKVGEGFEIAEARTGRTILPSEVEATGSAPDAVLVLPVVPVSAVTEFVLLGENGRERPVSASRYRLEADEWTTVIRAVGLPDPDEAERIAGFRIRLLAGYRIVPEDDPDFPVTFDLPGTIKSAVKLIAGNLFASEGDTVIGRSVSRTTLTVDSLLNPYHVMPY